MPLSYQTERITINMKEELTAGGKEFIFVLLWAALFYFLCGCIMSLFGEYAFIGGIISVIVFAIFGYFVLIHYTARFTYQLRDGRLRINRMIGKRNREVDFSCSDIKGIYYGFKPGSFPKRYVNMTRSILSKKNVLYIEYISKTNEICGVAVEPSDKLRKKIEREKNKNNN